VSKFKLDHLLAEAERKVRNFVCEKFTVESNGVAWKPRVALRGVAEEIVVAAPRGSRSHCYGPAQKRKARSALHTPHLRESKQERALPCSFH